MMKRARTKRARAKRMVRIKMIRKRKKEPLRPPASHLDLRPAVMERHMICNYDPVMIYVLNHENY